MLHAEGRLVFLNTAETRDERIGIPVGYLQAKSQKHGEHEKHSHTGIQKQTEGIQTERLEQSLLLTTVLLDNSFYIRQY